jgi:hypothetical protein
VNPRDFNRTLSGIAHPSGPRKGLICPALAEQLPEATKEALTHHIVRRRQPLVTLLIPKALDLAWLHAMGYLHRTISPTTGLAFFHSAEHSIR